MTKLKIFTVLILLTGLTSTAYAQTLVSDYQLEWLFIRNNDAIRFEKELANCDSTIVLMDYKIDRMDKQAITKDSIVWQKDAIINLQLTDIEVKNEEITNLNNSVERKSRIIKIGGGVISALLIMVLLR